MLTIEHMSMFVDKSIHIQIKGQVKDLSIEWSGIAYVVMHRVPVVLSIMSRDKITSKFI